MPSQLLTSAGVPGPSRPATWELLLRDKVRGMFSFNATSLAGHAIGALVIETVFVGAPLGLRLGWGGVFALVWLVRVALALRRAGPLPLDVTQLGVARNTWVFGLLTTAALWGWAGWSFFGYGSALEQIALIVVVYTFCVACVPILAPQFRLYLVFVALVDLPVIARVATRGDPVAPQIAFVMFLAMSMTLVLGRNYRDVFAALSRLQRRNEALVAELRAETEVAEAARGEAEVANLAKTRFFAAASHDLRQPLHAMGLFAEALRQRVRQPEVAGLVASINESVDALEGLFSELLDITRIDSGGVEVRPQVFEVAPLLRRIGVHFEPAAFEKGLALRLRGGRHAVVADPLLVERILRNLVSNAIRYTIDGTVLVGCRRRGATVRLQVWDTGVGIRADDQRKVFDEFHQLPAAPDAPPEQRKGLGLGLAIVKRLAELLDAPLTLRSVPGRGSVFTLELPVGRAAVDTPAVTSAPVATGFVSLGGRSIVVVDDDDAVRTGIEVLLGAWGARVLAFDGLASCAAWAGARDAMQAAPDLLIVDYRLAADATGLDVIALLRGRFGERLPAIVVTGSSLAIEELGARAHDVHLLMKPVLPTRLRAMIAFKLQGTSPASGAG